MKLIPIFLLLIIAGSCAFKERINKEEVVVVTIDKSMLPVRIIPESNMESVVIAKDGKVYSDYAWFRRVE